MGVTLYVRELFESLEPNGNDNIGCLWIKVRVNANKAHAMVGVYYRSLNQNEETDETFYKQEEVL